MQQIRRTRFGWATILLLGLACLTAPVLKAQRYLGEIRGQVSDMTGAKVPGAKVTATESLTNFASTVMTGQDGTFDFPALQPGTYTVTVESSGFKKEVKVGVVVTAAQTQQVDYSLVPGSASESVQVTAESTTLLDTGSPNVSTTLSTQEVTDLPNEGRNPYVMATLAAGVVDTASGGYFQGKSSQFTNPFSGVAVQVTTDGNGGHNRLTLDGIPNDPAERFSGASYTGFVPSPEAVQEVKVQTSIFDAQVGHGNGTVTNTVVRTGNNSLHGAAYYVFQNTYLNANTYEKAALNQARNNDQVSQTGLVLDGPVVLPKLYNGRDKTFFMFSFEQYQTHTAINYSSRVPTAAELGGDFSGLCNTFNSNGLCTSGVQLYDPLSPVDSQGNRTAYFPNNNIASRLNGTGTAMAAYLPKPNVTAATALTNPNYVSTQTSYRSTYPSFIGRFDHAIGANNKLNIIGFRSGLTQAYPLEGFPKGIGPTTSGTGYGYSVYRNNRGGSIDDVQQFSSTMVLDSRLGLVYHPFGLVYPGNSKFNLSSLNMTTSGLPYNTFPGEYMSSDGYAGLAPGAGGQISANTVISLDEILTKVWTNHTVRFGWDGNLIRYNVQNPQSGFGTNATTHPGFEFDRRFTQQNVNVPVGSQAGSGDPMASMLLGYFSAANYYINIAYAMQQLYMAPFVQDDWRVNNKLTLNLGVRWDYEAPFTERYNRMISNFCTSCSNPLQSSVSGITLNGGLQFVDSGHRFPYSRDLNNWQPRLGFAYQATPHTVVRGGYGIIYFNTLETPFSSGFSQATSYTNTTDGAHPINSMTDPFPSGVVTPTGNSLGLGTALGQNLNFPDPHHTQPKSSQFTVNVQQEFPGNLSFQLAYVGARPTQLEVNHNINVLPQQYYDQGSAEVSYLNAKVTNPMAGKIPGNATLNGSTIQRYLLLLPYPEFGSVTEAYSSNGSAPYNALQVQVSRPMTKHLSLQGNFTWDKVMLHTSYLNGFDTRLASIQDSNATLLGNIWATYELPSFAGHAYAERLALGGWKLNTVFRAANGNLVNAPSNVDIIGPVIQQNPTYARYFNTCYEDVNGNPVASTASAPACDALSPTPAYRQRLSYTTQHNSPVIGVRQRIHPLLDASLFKVFTIHERTSFEIRGEFFNILNTANFGGPGTGIGSSTFGVVTKTQANDPRIGQLTARINF